MMFVRSFVLFCSIACNNLLFSDGGLKTSADVIEQGEIQYKLLQERGRLPKYGNCWRQAVDHVEVSCRALTEETQSDVALHFTNCFLEMSGHDTYNCCNDKKPNVRAICISSMTDRAFNTYTEFYTHTHNICWFLRGQMWQETIAENTERVGKQQEALLQHQRESLAIQERIIKHSVDLEQTLGSFVVKNREVMQVLSSTIGNLQSWLIGEVSWVDSVLYFLVFSSVVVFMTSTHRTFPARLPLLLLLSLNFVVERLLYYNLNAEQAIDAKLSFGDYLINVWYIRYGFVTSSLLVLTHACFSYKDYLVENHALLECLNEEMQQLGEAVKKIGDSVPTVEIDALYECQSPANSDCNSAVMRRKRKYTRTQIAPSSPYNLRKNAITTQFS